MLLNTLTRPTTLYSHPQFPELSTSMSPSSFTHEGFSPPANFAMVGNGGSVYRSSFPKPENFPYLQKLKLKSIMYEDLNPGLTSQPQVLTMI